MSTAWVAAATPGLAGHVQAVIFDPDADRLDVAPDSPAFGLFRERLLDCAQPVGQGILFFA
ncbi:hypothetical protein ABZ829_22185 [Streptomyces xanthochromogenes]|uniref:hypothetical protein n=1 Tax=Streptomyces xanthochromogenes TaxID=67384 RepID=UPI00341BA396